MGRCIDTESGYRVWLRGQIIACPFLSLHSFLGHTLCHLFHFFVSLLLLLLFGQHGKRLEATGKQTFLLTDNHWQTITFVLTGKQSLLRKSHLLLLHPQWHAANGSDLYYLQLLDLVSLKELG